MKVDQLNTRWKWMLFATLSAAMLVVAPISSAQAKIDTVEITKKTAEAQIRNLLQPVLEKHCREECKMMSVAVTVDVATPDEIAPGFDEVDGHAANLAASSARVKLLINEKVGPVSRTKLLDLVQLYLDTLDYPVKVDTQLAHFPEPIESSGRVAEMRERIAKQFKATVEELFGQFCPNQCMLADFNLQTELVNGEEAQYGAPGEFVQQGGVAIRIKDISGTLLMDDTMTQVERNNVVEMAKLKTNAFKNVSLIAKAMKFPRPSIDFAAGAIDPLTGKPVGRSLASESKQNSDSKNSTSSINTNNNATNESTVRQENKVENKQENKQEMKQERFERIEKIERVESGDAVQAELQKFKVYGLIFACSILSLLIFLAMANFRPKNSPLPSVQRVIQSITSDPVSSSAPSTYKGSDVSANGKEDRSLLVAKRYEIEALMEELTKVYAIQPKVAKQVFGRILTEEGVEVMAQYVHLFGESIVVDLLRDPSLQSDLSELMEYYAKTAIELDDDEKLELLRSLHNRTITGKLVVLGNRSSNLFDFVAEMEAMQILELIRNESLTVKAMVLTQCDPQKRSNIYSHLDDDTRMKLLSELSRIDHLPRDYIYNVSNALKRKRRENPKLNTESLPGSEVLVSLLERTGTNMQRTVVKNLESTNPESARTIKSKLVSIDTLRYLRDNQLLEVILSLKHDELLQFLKGAPDPIRYTVFAKAPKELIAELEEELASVGAINRETYQAVERKVLNRMKLMTNDGLINLVETNERMFGDNAVDPGFVQATPGDASAKSNVANLKKVAGW